MSNLQITLFIFGSACMLLAWKWDRFFGETPYRTIKTPPYKPSIPIEEIRRGVQAVLARRLLEQETEAKRIEKLAQEANRTAEAIRQLNIIASEHVPRIDELPHLSGGR